MNEKITPPQEIYDDFYFKHSCGGYEEFKASKGEILPPWMVYAFELAKLKPSDKVLDIGTGRGEIVYQSARVGNLSVGVDYAKAALRFAESLRMKAAELNHPFELILADARNLPFTPNQFSVVFMLDIVEHLSQRDLRHVFKGVHQCLQPGGRLIIHTMPNLNYYKYGYPIYRLVNLLLGKNLPKDPRKRFYRGETHINIQTPKSLRLNLASAGFIDPYIELNQLSGSKPKRLLCRLPLIKHVLSNDIIAIGTKEDE